MTTDETMAREGYGVPSCFEAADSGRLLHTGALAVDPDERTASWRGRELELPPRRAALLAELARGAGRTVGRETLIAAAGIDGTRLTAHAHRLRRGLALLIGCVGPEYRPVFGVRGVGLRLQLPSDPRFVRCWGAEVDGRDRDNPQLRVNGGEWPVAPAVGALLAAVIAAAGVVVGDTELRVRAGIGSAEVATVLRRFHGLVEAVGEGHRFVVENVTPGLLQVGALTLDPATGQALYRGHEADLAKRMRVVLAALMRSPTRQLGRTELLALAWPNGGGTTGGLAALVSEMRLRLPEREGAPSLIVPTRSGGYGLRADHDQRPLPLRHGALERDPDTREARENGLQVVAGPPRARAGRRVQRLRGTSGGFSGLWTGSQPDAAVAPELSRAPARDVELPVRSE